MSEVSICNQAIGWLGGNRITALTDGTTEANLCSDNYAPLRDAVLEAADWSFAIKRIDLAAEVDTPAFGFSKQFQIPSDCLRVLSVSLGWDDNRRYNWKREGQFILINADLIYIRYVARIENTEEFSSLFTTALAQRIAADLAITLTEDRKKQEVHWALYESKLDEAATVDGLQGKPDTIRADHLVMSRQQGGKVAGPYV